MPMEILREIQSNVTDMTHLIYFSFKHGMTNGHEKIKQSAYREDRYLIIFHRKQWETFIVSPSDDIYYYWLFFIAAAVLYNWVLLVARCDFSSSLSPLQILHYPLLMCC